MVNKKGPSNLSSWEDIDYITNELFNKNITIEKDTNDIRKKIELSMKKAKEDAKEKMNPVKKEETIEDIEKRLSEIENQLQFLEENKWWSEITLFDLNHEVMEKWVKFFLLKEKRELLKKKEKFTEK